MAQRTSGISCRSRSYCCSFENSSSRYGAMLAFNPVGTLEENEENMQEALSHVKTGQITYAVRDTEIDGVAIQKDDFMCIVDGKIVSTNAEK